MFVDGAFWHGHPDYFTFGKSGDDWDRKIRRNIQRDREVDAQLFAMGWRSCRVWDFEVLADPDEVAYRLAAVVRAVPQPRAAGSPSRGAARLVERESA